MYEYVTWFRLPDEAKSCGGFYQDVQELVIEPLRSVGYCLLDHCLEGAWDLEIARAELSLEYQEDADAFTLSIVEEKDADLVIYDVLTHTALQKC